MMKNKSLTPYYHRDNITIYCGDCLELLKSLPDNSVDSCVTDPPYGINFMGKKWDYEVPSIEVWQELLRVLKPGAYILVACGTRTQHRMAVNIEDAGFEIRDIISWIYGSGFPKSHNISKAIDKAAGAEQKRSGNYTNKHSSYSDNKIMNKFSSNQYDKDSGKIFETEPATDEAKEWDGWGTALKPSQELFTLARKPLSEDTVAANVLKWGTGAINIDGCRVEANDKAKFPEGVVSNTENNYGNGMGMYDNRPRTKDENPQGRWPANLIHDGSDEVVEMFPEPHGAGYEKEKFGNATPSEQWGGTFGKGPNGRRIGDSGSAARFFYCAKVSNAERNLGLDDNENNHPTVKPIALIRYLIRLITPPNGTVIDPFLGSGTTAMAAILENKKCIGVELEPDYCDIAQGRIIYTSQDYCKIAVDRLRQPSFFSLPQMKQEPEYKQTVMYDEEGE